MSSRTYSNAKDCLKTMMYSHYDAALCNTMKIHNLLSRFFSKEIIFGKISTIFYQKFTSQLALKKNTFQELYKCLSLRTKC